MLLFPSHPAVARQRNSWTPTFLFMFAAVTSFGCGPRSSITYEPPTTALQEIGRFELGTPATPAEIEAWDIDIMPDGTGLPRGEGSVTKGARIYAEQCARCHGGRGEGRPFDPLAGRIEADAFPFAEDPKLEKTVGNYWPYATTLFDYTRRAMPLDRPGSLSNDEVYAVTAFVLFLNDLVPEGTTLDAETLPGIEMPARDRFVDDDRRGGPEIR